MAIAALVASLTLAYLSARRTVKKQRSDSIEDHIQPKQDLKSYLMYPVDKVGSAIVNAYDYIASWNLQKEVSILILGLDGSGKTSILNRLNRGELVPTTTFINPRVITQSLTSSTSPQNPDASAPSSEAQEPPPPPTIGFNLEEITHPTNSKVRFKIWDLGGQSAVRPLWRCYTANANAVVFVVDAADPDRAPTAGAELLDLLDNTEEGESLPDGAAVLVLANKKDIVGAMTNGELWERMGLLHSERAKSIMEKRRWSICQCSAITGEGLMETVDWLTGAILGEGHAKKWW